jgi:RNA polymerase sigma-70 factor (ECF subfamily)
MNDSDDRDRSVTFTPDDRAFVYAVVRRIVRDEDDAHDATQDALLSAFRHRASFAGKARYRTWLYRVAVTSALSHLRRARHSRVTRSLDPSGADRDLLATTETPERALATAQDHHTLRGHLARLDPRYSRVLELRLDEDLGEAEVADALGLTVSTVKIRGHRARAALRASLAHAM